MFIFEATQGSKRTTLLKKRENDLSPCSSTNVQIVLVTNKKGVRPLALPPSMAAIKIEEWETALPNHRPTMRLKMKNVIDRRKIGSFSCCSKPPRGSKGKEKEG